MIDPEVAGKVAESIDNYSRNIQGKGVREILNTDYVPPDLSDINGSGVDLSDPDTRAAVNFWADTMKEWRQKYGDIEGYNEFNNAWSIRDYDGGNPDFDGADSAKEAFTSSKYQSVRDKYGYAR